VMDSETNCTVGCCLNNVNLMGVADVDDICKPASGGCPIIQDPDYEEPKYSPCTYFSSDFGDTMTYDCPQYERCCEDNDYTSEGRLEDMPQICSTNYICPEDNHDRFRKSPGDAVEYNDITGEYDNDCLLMKSSDDEFKTYGCGDWAEDDGEYNRCCLAKYTTFYGEDSDVCQASCSVAQSVVSDVCIYKLYDDAFYTKVNCYNGDRCCHANYTDKMWPEERLMCTSGSAGDEYDMCDWKGDNYDSYYCGAACDDDEGGMAWWIVLIIVIVIIIIIIILLLFCYMFYFKRSVVQPEPTKDVEALPAVEDTDRLDRLAYVEGLLDGSISSKNITELKKAISETEANGFEKDLNKKYKKAKELLQKELDRQAKEQAELDRRNAEDKDKADKLAYVEGLLDDAIESESVDDLKFAIGQTEINFFKIELDEKYRKAKDLLQKKLDRQARQAEVEKMLDQAIKNRDPAALREAIAEVENHGFEMELDTKYKEAKRLLEELDDRQSRLARVEGMLDGGISSKDPAELQAAILETEKNGFQDDLEEKYNLAKKALQIYYHDLEEEAKRKALEEAERLAQEEKERMEAAQRELERLQREKAEADRIAEAQRIADEAKARWSKMWPRFMLLKGLKDLHESTKLSSEERAKLEAELAEKERIRQIGIQQVREQLDAAYEAMPKSIEQLRKAIKACEENQYEKDLDLEYTRAKALLERLERIARVRKAVMDLDRPLLAELRSFGDPPPAVHKTLIASYLLMGENRKSVDNWKEVVIMLGKTGKLSVKRRVQQLEVEDIKVETATEAYEFIKDLDSDTVYEANQAAALFYEWSDLMCDETFRTAKEKK